MKEKSIMNEIQRIQDLIQLTYDRINVLENKLTKQITIENRESLESELSTAKEVLDRNKKKLSQLHKANTKTFMIAACVVFFLFLIFGLYSMIFNIN